MATVKRRNWTNAKGEKKEAWRVSYTDSAGKRRFKQYEKKKNADAYRIKIEGELATGIHTADAASITVAKACDVWLAAAKEGGCDRGTLKAYKEVVNGHIKPLLGKDKLSRLTGPKIVEFRTALLATRSHAMTSKAVRHLSMVLKEALTRGYVAQNVAAQVKVRRPRGERHRIALRAEIPPKEHLQALLAAADKVGATDPRAPALVRVAMFAGLRSSEVRGFPWANADLSGQTLSVTQRADRWNDIGYPKSKAGVRTVPIGPALARSLKEWKLRCPPSESGLMFPNKRGGVMDQKSTIALFLAVQVAAGLAIDTGKTDKAGQTIWKARYGLHHLRHAAASFWIADGIDLKRLQVWIGHENIALTVDVYGHLIADKKKDAELAAGAEAALLA